MFVWPAAEAPGAANRRLARGGEARRRSCGPTTSDRHLVPARSAR
ncbi:hypothetical protein PAI11_34790 [Patulibacter medicamentivorans]|uniref:Uncharacterized protein n=1 Tax=Patulibacter medicamentivorans TaxID=1097667 RepID=H0E9G0_9ACTN|nr:hypothetical protein PAI11_34790 [Patulibacter medicamentivorans]